VLEEHGLRPRSLVALTLLRDHDGFSQQGLAATLQIDKTNLVGLLNDLENDALVARRRSPEDRRRHLVEITAAGTAKLSEAEEALAAVEDDVLGVLSEEERETLYRLLRRTQDWPAGD
jgi:DNA-binding MarR family transcriptional regulator